MDSPPIEVFERESDLKNEFTTGDAFSAMRALFFTAQKHKDALMKTLDSMRRVQNYMEFHAVGQKEQASRITEIWNKVEKEADTIEGLLLENPFTYS